MSGSDSYYIATVTAGDYRERLPDPDAALECDECGKGFGDDDDVCPDDDDLYCEGCAARYVEQLESEAKAFALANCEITGELDEHNRRNRTNYDDLIQALPSRVRAGGEPSFLAIRDSIFFSEIRSRIDELIEAELARVGDQKLDDLIGDDGDD